MSELVKITVDGKEVSVPGGQLLVEAAKAAGVEIPVFCYHPKLDPAGVCRMCLVEVEGQRKPVTACTMPVSDGMVVKTETDLVTDLRKGVLEFLLLNHPLDCPVCDKGGECPLQDNTFKYGPGQSRSLDLKVRQNKAVDLGNFIVLDQERCILCRRCTRFDDEITQEEGLVIEERAGETMVGTAHGERFNSYFSGNTIEMCPVGALTSELYRFRARPWDLGQAPSVCTGCSVGCNTQLDFRFGKLVRVLSRENEATDGGWLCDRGRFNYTYVHDDERRLKQPLIKRDGRFHEASWEEAIQEIAGRLRTIRRDHGGERIGVLGGGRLTNEEAYLLQKFARLSLGTPHIDHRVGGQHIASAGAFAGRITDIDDADALLLVDVLLAERAPVLDLRVRRAAERGGAQLVTVGPAVPRYRPAFRSFDGLPGESAAHLQSDALQQALGDPKKLVAVWGGDDAAAGQALFQLLQAYADEGVAVHLLIPGEQGNSRGAEWMGAHPELLPGGRSVRDDADRNRFERAWGDPLPSESGFDTGQMLEAAARGDLQALLLFGANPAGTHPDGALAKRALQAVPFLVVSDLFLTETAEAADVVLPASAFAAKAGTYTALDGRVQKVDAGMPTQFESRPDGEAIRAVAAAVGKPVVSSEQEFRWELQHHVGELADGTYAPGLGAGAAARALDSGRSWSVADGDGLVLIPVERLFAGGGTARFDAGLAQSRPGPVARFHPADAARLEIETDDQVHLTFGSTELSLGVEIGDGVVEGTVQVPKGLAEAPVNALTDGRFPRAGVARQVLEEVG